MDDADLVRLRASVKAQMVRLKLSNRQLVNLLHDAPNDLYPYKPGGHTVIGYFLNDQKKEPRMVDCMQRWLRESRSMPTPRPQKGK